MVELDGEWSCEQFVSYEMVLEILMVRPQMKVDFGAVISFIIFGNLKSKHLRDDSIKSFFLFSPNA